MEIYCLKNINKDKTLVFVLKAGEEILKHHLFDYLDAYDKKFVLNFFKKNKIKPGDNYLLLLPSEKEILILGEIENSKFNHRRALKLTRRVIFTAKKFKKENLILNFLDFKGFDFNYLDIDLAEILSTQFEMANFEFIDYKSNQKDYFFVKEIQIFYLNKKYETEMNKHLNYGKIIGEETNFARKLANIPGGDMTPELLANEAKKAASRFKKIKIKILNEKEIKRLNLNGILSVSKGSLEKPKFIILEYFAGPKNEKPIVFIGKGITFDSGGLNLKPTEGIYEMHMDMTGGAVAIHSLIALARLKVPKNIVVLVPACENMPSGSSYRPGDIIKTLNGKTIEVLNTDAEGRIVLADAISYALKYYNPQLIIDVATLTGAAMVALGLRASAIFGNNQKIIQKAQEVGEFSGDFIWQLPLWEEYEEDIRGNFGDISNAPKNRYGGAIAGAMFLYQFIKSEKEPVWMHLDVAPRMTSIEGDFFAKGSLAPGALLLTYLIYKFL
jgi:leucyl aminopeptidase